MDNGINLNSDIINKVYSLFGIQVINTSLYKACANLVERFNGTLKRMLIRMVAEKPREWHKYLDSCLFAYRDSIHTSIGISPFEMIFGRQVVGPLKLLKEIWTKEDLPLETRTNYQYVLDLKNKITETCKYAQEQLKLEQLKNKKAYDKKAKHRDIRVNDKVYILRSVSSNKLKMRWSGPYEVTKKIGKYNFMIMVDGEEKSYHVNNLKVHNERQKQEEINTLTVVEDEDGDEDHDQIKIQDRNDLILLESKNNSSISDVKYGEQLTNKQLKEAKDLVNKYSDIFSDVPKRTNLETFKVTLRSNDCVQLKPYPIPYHLREQVEKEIDDMLQMGVIEKVDYPTKYCSPIVTVKKPDGSLRLCVNYKKVNQLLLPDVEMTNLAEDIFYKIGDSKFYSKFDLAKGYWQIPVDEDSKDITIFTSHKGMFKFNVLPFGIQAGSQVFCRLMRKLLAGSRNIENYIDDVLAYNKTWEDHLETIEDFFLRIRNANLSIKPSKCEIGVKTVEFLGQNIYENTITPNVNNMKKLFDATVPKTKSNVKSFLGLIGFYSNFLENFSEHCAPLTDLLKKGLPEKVNWGPEQNQAFLKLKEFLFSNAILKLPCLEKEFVLRTDSSDIAVSAGLFQEHEGKLHPVCFSSQKLTPTQKRFAISEKEALAIIFGVKKFYKFLYGKSFTIETDHKALECIKEGKIESQRLLRWALYLQNFDFKIKYIKGALNHGPDVLTRHFPDE